jgi:stage II sporulation protein GA (sporulation sigma-E factor processing peptidase)
MTVVYIDLLFLLNLVANYLLLLGAGRVAGTVLRRGRIASGAALGALYAALIFLPHLDWLGLWPCKLAAGVLMALVAYGGEPGLLRVTVLFFCASAGLAGAVLAMELLGGAALTLDHGVFYSALDLRLLLLLFVACYFVLSLFFRRAGRHVGRELAKLELELPDGSVTLTALRDSGHTLTDPATNRPIVVAYQATLAHLLPPYLDAGKPVESLGRCREAGLHGARLVPYRAVGVDCGLLVALRAQSVRLDGRPMGALLVALSPTPLGDGGAYQALIGGI